MDTLADYSAWKAKQQQNGVGAATVVLGSVDAKPDEVAGDLNLASEFGKTTGNPTPPLPMVKEYRNVFQQAIEREKAKTVLSTAPRLTEWLRNPENAAVARDDLENMSWFEGFGRGTSNALSRSADRFGQMYDQYMLNHAAGRLQDRQSSFGEILDSERDVTKTPKGDIKSWITLGDMLSASGRYIDAKYADLIGTDDAENARGYAAALQANIDKMRATPKSGIATDAEKSMFVDGSTLGQTVQNVGSTLLSNPLGVMSWALETAAESAPQLAAALGVTAATRNPALGLGALTAGSYVTERYTAPADFLAEKGIDLSNADDVGRVLSDPVLLKEANDRGVTRGLVVAAFDFLSAGLAGKTLAHNPMVEALGQTVQQAISGALGEYSARVAAGQEIDWNDIIAEGLAEMATTPVDMGIAGRKLHADRMKAKAAEGTAAEIQQMSAQAQGSALRNRMPDKFRQFVEAAAANGPVENVYVPADQFSTYFQSIGVDPHALIDGLEGVTRDDLDAALAGGGDLKIPTATYAAKIAGSEHDAFLMENMRFDPNEFTSAEARAFNEHAEDAMHEAWELAEQERLDAEQSRSFEQEIYDKMVSNLRSAGRSTDVATTEAVLYPAFYRSMAERSGLTVEEFMQKYPLPDVRGDLPEGMQFRNVDELNRTLAEARSAKAVRDNRTTLLDFISNYGGINDVGGELRARDAETIKRGRGKKTLKLARSGVMAGVRDMFASRDGKRHGADDVAHAAIEAGFLANDPIAQEYLNAVEQGRQVPDITAALWDAIDRELQGSPEFSSHEAVDPAVEEAAKLDGIEEYLSSLGVSLDDDDATIRQAVEGEGKKFAQFAGSRSDTLDRGALMLAQDMESSGALRDEIYDATGFFKGPDGRWRFEISDADATINEHQLSEHNGYRTAMTKLGNVLLHPKLFAAYPQLANLPLDLTIKDGIKRGGRYDGQVIAVKGKDIEEARSILLHEVAHAVQHIEGFANGGNTSMGELYEGENVELFRGEIKRLTAKWEAARDRNDADAMIDIADEVEQAQRNMSRAAAFEFYRRIAGEVEARNVQTRDRMKRGADEHERRWAEVLGTKQGESRIDAPWWTADVDPHEVIIVRTPDHGEAFEAMSAAQPEKGATTQAEVDAFADGLAAELGMRSLSLFLTGHGDLKLNMIAMPKDKLGSGGGTAAMKRITDFADVHGLRVTLTTGEKDDGFGTTSRARLVKFYKRFGFVENKGRNKDFAISDNMIREPKKRGPLLFQGAHTGPRGSIQFPAGGVGNGDTIIRLFQSADLSTMLHESGHYFLTVLQDLADKGEAQAIGHYSAVKDWWRSNADSVAKNATRATPITADDVIAALDNGTTGDAVKDAAIDVGMQEQWARAFEQYLMEGKAPNAELRGAFEKFRAWLISVYRKISNLNVNVSPELRGVFDRMLASDEEIAKAQADTGDTGPLFATAEAMGLTPDEYTSFLKLRSQAEDDAKARLLRETMAPIKRAQEKWFKEEKAKVREEVEREVNAYRYFRAIEWMGNRRWFGDGQPSDMPDIRLSKDILVQRYGKGVLDTLPRGKQTVYAVEGGIDPDDAAGWFGFDSGDEMIKAMERAPKRTEAIDAEADKVMRERHGDALHDGAIEAEALDAVHTDKRGEWIAAELKAVVEIAGTGNVLTAKEARASVRSTIARMRVRDAINANRFLAAERKAAEEAGRLGAMLARDGVWLQNAARRMQSKARAASRGEASADAVNTAIEKRNRILESKAVQFKVEDRTINTKAGPRTIEGGDRTSHISGYNENVAKLVEAKRRQLLNHAFYMEARKVADEVEKAERFVAKLSKKTTREKIAGAGRRENAQVDYLSAIDELLERYDFRKVSGAAEQRRGSLLAFVEAMKAAGRENELAIPDDVLTKAARAPYKTLPVEELRGVVDSLKNLEHMALRWNALIDGQQQRELDAVATDIVAAFDANLPKRPPGRVRTKAEALRHSVRQFLDLVLNATTVLREIDGFADLGAAYRNIKTPIDGAMSRLIGRKEKAAADLEALYSVYSKDERRRMSVREHIPELGYALSKWERIAVALNTGNAGNYQRLTDPKVRGSLTEAQVAQIIYSLDNRDGDFIQSVWDYIGSFRNDIAAREKRTTGVEPEWVEATPVFIGTRELKGGYYPIKYDPRLSSLARDDETQEIAQSLQAGRFGKAQTRQGHLKDRAQSSGRDVELDMSVLHRHVNQVIYDLELSEPVANSWRILQDGRVRNAFMEAGKSADFDALETWLKDVAEGELRSADFVGRAARTLKSNFTAAKLALNLSTVAMQITGVSQSMVVVGKKDFALGVQASFRRGVLADITGKSRFMASRQTTFNKDIYDFYSDPKTGPVASRWGEIKSEIIGPLSFWLMTKVQWHAVDVPTWLAGYQQGLRKFGNDEAKAIEHADDIVKRSQASGLFSDRSAIERGSVSRTARQNDVVRLFTTLGSYMFAKFNVAYERSGKAQRVIAQEGVSVKSAQEALSWTVDMAFLFMLEAVVTAAIKGRLPDDDDDDDDEWAAFLAKQTAFSVMSTIPFVRDASSAAQGFSGGGAYGGAVEDAAKGVYSGGKVILSPLTGAEVTKTDIKQIINGTGLATGLPATQINRAVSAGLRQAEGKDVSPLEYLLGHIGK